MVTLQILVLPFLVRVRVPQHKKIAKWLMNNDLAIFFFGCFKTVSDYENSNKTEKISLLFRRLFFFIIFAKYYLPKIITCIISKLE